MMGANQAAIGAIADLLEERTGQKLGHSRSWRIGTALAGLFRQHGIHSVEQLAVQLTQPGQSALAQDVVEALLNHETYFFRDRAMFDQIAQAILPEIAARHAGRRRLAIWSAGCSTGQEPLSLAMLFAREPERWDGWKIDILATDISAAAIGRARSGCYSSFEIQRGLGLGEMLDCFRETPDGWEAEGHLLRMLRHERHNLLDLAPAPGAFDLVLCRNVLLYFDADTRRRAFDRLARALAGGGLLMLGAGETVIGQTDRLAPSQRHAGFFRVPEAAPRGPQ